MIPYLCLPFHFVSWLNLFSVLLLLFFGFIYAPSHFFTVHTLFTCKAS